MHDGYVATTYSPKKVKPQKNMTTSQYINNINQRYQFGNATEHTFRGDLQQLLES
jgi:hypothetical protein